MIKHRNFSILEYANNLKTFSSLQSFSYNLFIFFIQIGVIGYIALFPFGQAFREIFSILAFSGTLGLYTTHYSHSNMHSFPGRYLFFCFFLYLIIKAFVTIDHETSLYALKQISYDSLLLFPAGVEFVRKKNDLALAVLISSVMLFVLGLDAIYQYITGYDIFKNIPMYGKMTTASMRLPHLGTITAVILPFTIGFFYILNSKINIYTTYFFTIIVISTPLFFIYTSDRRSAWIGLFAFILFYLLIKHKKIFTFTLFALCVTLLTPVRLFFVTQLIENIRWQIWQKAVLIFMNKPLFGHGLHTFKPALIEYNFQLTHKDSGSLFESPHNIYLGFLVDGGLLSLLLFLTFSLYLLYFALKMYTKVATTDNKAGNMLFLGACAYVSYLGCAFTGLDFYKTWMLGPSMILLGVTIGFATKSNEADFLTRDGNCEKL